MIEDISGFTYLGNTASTSGETEENISSTIGKVRLSSLQEQEQEHPSANQTQALHLHINSTLLYGP